MKSVQAFAEFIRTRCYPPRGGRLRSAQAAGAEILQRLLDLGRRVHHERAVLRDRLAQRAPGEDAPERQRVHAEEQVKRATADEGSGDQQFVGQRIEQPAQAAGPAVALGQPAVEPVAYEYKWPETLTINDEQRTEFNSILDSFRADPVKGTQGLVDLHARLVNDAVQGAAKQLELRQYTTFNETRMDWRNQMAADEEIGGSAIKTSRTNALAVINRFVDEKHRPGLESMLYVTGVGDHPEFVRILNRIGKFMREPGLPPANFNPVPDGGKNPGLSREQRLYGKA